VSPRQAQAIDALGRRISLNEQGVSRLGVSALRHLLYAQGALDGYPMLLPPSQNGALRIQRVGPGGHRADGDRDPTESAVSGQPSLHVDNQ